ncbi:hypothetical protein SLE2022_195070 [Rubroshorea leprosula]
MIDEGVKLLLDQFKEACLNMEDALDEWRTVILEVQITAVKSAYFLPRKVCHLLQSFYFDHTIRHHEIAHNIKVINGRLDEIVKEKNIYQLTCKNVKQPKITFEYGAPGSRIFVTNTVHLERLNQEECWFMLREIAFSGRDKKTNEDLEEIGKQLAAKCKGVLLAVKIIGVF